MTKEDLARVSVADVQQLRSTLTDADLRAAIRLMLERNQFGDILAAAPPTAWAVALTDVSPSQMAITGTLIKEQMSLLYAVLPYVTENFLESIWASCATSLVR